MSGPSRRRFLAGSAGIAGAMAFPPAARAAQRPGPPPVLPGAAQVMANNVGYEPTAPKHAVIADHAPGHSSRPFQVVDVASGDVVHTGSATYVGPVADWLANSFPSVPGFYWRADFSDLTTPGEYVITLDGAGFPTVSHPFRVEASLLERRTLSHVVHYFKDSRSCGQFDKADRTLPLKGTTTTFDARGGWWDAAADWGKHFTQLSNVSFFNTLSIPLTAWVLQAAHDELAAREDADVDFVSLTTWLLDEALFGADYLARVHKPGQTFYSSVSQPEADDLSVDPTQRTLSAHQVNFREGGGLAIAALARASTYPVSGDFTSAQYLAAAEDAFAYLAVNNARLTNDGKENILDDYNALLAATELAIATRNPTYRQAADARATNLVDRLHTWQGFVDYWRADDVDRPFFHPSDAGLPIVSLVRYLAIASPQMQARVRDAVARSMRFELAVTAQVPNPFGYARQLVQDATGHRFSGFFFPHNVTPRSQDAWWQGENARIGSLATAARLAARAVGDGTLTTALRTYSADQLNWIVGVNPFNVSMMDGVGREAPIYLEYPDTPPTGSWRWLRSAGGIVNGITGKADDGSGLQWDPGAALTGPNTDWRWLEQWLPHATWFLYAASIGSA